MEAERLKQIAAELEAEAPIENCFVQIEGEDSDEIGITGNRAGMFRLAADALRAAEGSSGQSRDVTPYFAHGAPPMENLHVNWVACTNTLIPPPPRTRMEKFRDALGGIGCLIVGVTCLSGGVYLIQRTAWWLAFFVGIVAIFTALSFWFGPKKRAE